MTATAPLGPAETARYARHLVLPEVGRAGQERLKAARALLVGAGGLGSPAALYLAAAGVGTLGVVDPDVVDATNLQRQVLHRTSDLDRLKVDSAKQALSDLNPHVHVEAYPQKLVSDNAMGIVAEYDVVLDGSDNFPARYLVNDACVLSGKPNVYGAVHRWEGQLAVFGTKGGPCYRCLFREPPPPGMVPNCAEAGVFGALPGVVGAAQALEAIKLLLGVGEPVAGRLLIFDALAHRWRELEVRRDHSCPVCGDSPTIAAPIDYDLFCGAAQAPDLDPDPDENSVGNLYPGDLIAALTDAPAPNSAPVPPSDGGGPVAPSDAGGPVAPADAGTAVAPADARRPVAPHSASPPVAPSGDARSRPRPFLLDVREPVEWHAMNLSGLGAVLVPMGEVPERLDEIPRDRPVVVYCHSGVRSLEVAKLLVAQGWSDVRNLEGGIAAVLEETPEAVGGEL